jgi:hypothetical protein
VADTHSNAAGYEKSPATGGINEEEHNRCEAKRISFACESIENASSNLHNEKGVLDARGDQIDVTLKTGNQENVSEIVDDDISTA